MSALVWPGILGLFVNTLTADNKYSLCNMEKFEQQVQTALPIKKRLFPDFLLDFWNVHQNPNIFKKKMSILA